LLFVSLHHVTGARWSASLLPIAHAVAAMLPVACAGLVAVFVLCPSLYPGYVPAAGAESPLRQSWLSRPFFLGRSLVYMGVWLAFGAAFARGSRWLDSGVILNPTAASIRLSAGYLVVYGITFWLASLDWVMSLEPAWSSTVWGVYQFCGQFLSALALITLLFIWLGSRSRSGSTIDRDVLHDLGTLLFSFSSFWMYLWFCQYMLIWYVNNPEETTYFLRRQGGWSAVLYLSLALNWGIPFVVLLFHSAKRSPRILGTVAVLVLCGRWVDLFLAILPTQDTASPVAGPLEWGLILGGIGAVGLTIARYLGRRAPLAMGAGSRVSSLDSDRSMPRSVS